MTQVSQSWLTLKQLKRSLGYIEIIPVTQREFPPADLMEKLITLYFNKTNICYPLLHRATFDDSISRGLHLADHQFGNTVLLVCALGSKFTEDLPVALDGNSSKKSAGSRWFEQVPGKHVQLFIALQLVPMLRYSY